MNETASVDVDHLADRPGRQLAFTERVQNPALCRVEMKLRWDHPIDEPAEPRRHLPA